MSSKIIVLLVGTAELFLIGALIGYLKGKQKTATEGKDNTKTLSEISALMILILLLHPIFLMIHYLYLFQTIIKERQIRCIE